MSWLLPLVFVSASAVAAPAPRSHIEAAAVVVAKDTLSVTLRVVPDKGLHINQEGPWQLDLTPSAGLSFAKTTLKKDAVDFAVPGFVVKSSALLGAAGTLGYKMVAFVCTDDKSQCYRDVLSGELNWKR